MEHRIIWGDSRNISLIPDNSIHLIVTSPPYWQLKDYNGNDKQIGYQETYSDYINNLNLVWMECNRVLHSGCKACINIGDQFSRASVYGRYKVVPIRTEIIRFFEAIGFDYLGGIIWQKVTTCKTTGGASIMGSYPFPRNGIIKIDYEFILVFKKHGKPPVISREQKEASRLSREEWNEYFYGHWNIKGEKQSLHPAPFPVEIPYRLIRMYSFIGETILDPFLGSGTTTLAAMSANRNSIGYEIDEGYIRVIKQRLKEEASIQEIDLLKDFSSIDINSRLSSLPYIYEEALNPKRTK